MSPRRRSRNPRDYPRTARLNELLQRIIAEELERLGDERLDLVTVVDVEVEPDLRAGVVHVATLGEGDDDEQVLEALDDVAPSLKRAIGGQARLKRVPDLSFRTDEVGRSAARIEEILRDLGEERDRRGGADPEAP